MRHEICRSDVEHRERTLVYDKCLIFSLLSGRKALSVHAFTLEECEHRERMNTVNAMNAVNAVNIVNAVNTMKVK